MLLQQHYCDFYHYPNMQEIQYSVPRLVAQRQRQGFFFSVTWLRVSACTPVTSVVSYLPTGLVGCSVSPGISCGAYKLARTPRIKKKIKIQYSSEVSSHNNWSLSEGDNLHWKKVILYAVVSWIRLAVAYITPNTIHD
jgi:hypothetical protein